MKKMKLIDQYLSGLVIKFLFPMCSKFKSKKKYKSIFISIGNKSYSQIEDRGSIHFNLLSQAETDDKFYFLRVNRFLPGFYYAILLICFIVKYDCKILLFDYHHETRFPSLNFVDKLKSKIPVFCFWLETFDESISPVRIVPTLRTIDFHIVCDDPTLRIKEYAKCKEFSEKFYYFPLPIFPNKMFYNFESNEKKYDLCFYGNIEHSIHRSERKKFLEFLEKNNFSIHGFLAQGRQDLGRPSYDEMLEGLRKSRIGLNFSNHGQVGAVTNRVVEIIASGTVLLSSNEEVLKKLLRPNEDYLFFNDEEDLVKKIKILLDDEIGLRRISKFASESISSRYSAEKFIVFIKSLAN